MTDVFKDKVALVTGGSSGIGRATSLAFARQGARVAIADREPTGAAETARMIEEIGGTAAVFELDVTKADNVASVIDRIVQTYGRLDCAFNNAGVGGEVAKTADYREEEWDRIIDVNLKGVWLCMKYEIPVMERQGGGAIVNTASIYGLAGHGGYIAYNAAKHGVVGITRTAALEYATAGIRIQRRMPRLHPHTHDHPQNPGQPRFGAKDGLPDPHGQNGQTRGDRRGRCLVMLGRRFIRHRPHHDPRRRLHGPVAALKLAHPSPPKSSLHTHSCLPDTQVLTSSRRVSAMT